MIVRELITDKIPSIKSTDMAGTALDWMNEFKLSLLPVVDNGTYKGMVTEDDILDATSLEVKVGDIQYMGWDSAYIYEGKHIYDAIQVMSRFKLGILPVLDEENSYLGAITLPDLLPYLGNLLAMDEPGGIIVLEIPPKGYVLSEISRIAESENAKILSLYMSQPSKEGKYLLTLKLNIEDLSRVVASFERFQYTIIETYQHTIQLSNYQRNLDALMNYLDI